MVRPKIMPASVASMSGYAIDGFAARLAIASSRIRSRALLVVETPYRMRNAGLNKTRENGSGLSNGLSMRLSSAPMPANSWTAFSKILAISS